MEHLWYDITLIFQIYDKISDKLEPKIKYIKSNIPVTLNWFNMKIIYIFECYNLMIIIIFFL